MFTVCVYLNVVYHVSGVMEMLNQLMHFGTDTQNDQRMMYWQATFDKNPPRFRGVEDTTVSRPGSFMDPMTWLRAVLGARKIPENLESDVIRDRCTTYVRSTVCSTPHCARQLVEKQICIALNPGCTCDSAERAIGVELDPRHAITHQIPTLQEAVERLLWQWDGTQYQCIKCDKFSITKTILIATIQLPRVLVIRIDHLEGPGWSWSEVLNVGKTEYHLVAVQLCSRSHHVCYIRVHSGDWFLYDDLDDRAPKRVHDPTSPHTRGYRVRSLFYTRVNPPDLGSDTALTLGGFDIVERYKLTPRYYPHYCANVWISDSD